MQNNYNQKQTFKANDILAILDREASDYNFPMPNNLCHYNAGMLLTAFRNVSEWLIIFEM